MACFMARSNLVVCAFELGKLFESHVMGIYDKIDRRFMCMKIIGSQSVVCPCTGAI